MSLRNTYKTKKKNVEEQRVVEDLSEIEEFLKNEAQAKIELEEIQREHLGE